MHVVGYSLGGSAQFRWLAAQCGSCFPDQSGLSTCADSTDGFGHVDRVLVELVRKSTWTTPHTHHTCWKQRDLDRTL
jgi:hypothetical protein